MSAFQNTGSQICTVVHYSDPESALTEQEAEIKGNPDDKL